MMKLTLRLNLLAMVLSGVLVLGGCGGGSNNSGDAGSTGSGGTGTTGTGSAGSGSTGTGTGTGSTGTGSSGTSNGLSAGSCAGAAATSGSSGTLAITTQPAAQTVTVGQHALFCVVATGAASYQWSKDGSPISGATTEIYYT